MKLLALMKKEFHRFFHDPRLIITMLLPGIVIFALYSILGEAIRTEPEQYQYRVYLQGQSQATALIETVIGQSEGSIEWLPVEDEAAARDAVKQGDAAALVTFSEHFDDANVRGTVRIVYDPMNEAGSAFYGICSAVLMEYGMRFSILPESLATEEEIGKEVIQGILPFIVVSFIFSACMSLTLESVAGEKERGTIATLLVTSVKRSHIALGKVIPLSCIAMLGALSSFLGVALSMPKLMGMSIGFLGSYGFLSYLLLFLLIASIVPLITALIALVSALSRSMKEASGYVGMLMILIMVVSLVAAFVPALGDWTVVIPVLNVVSSMNGILSGSQIVWQSLVSVGMNLLYTAGLVFALSKIFSSEKIMFGK